MTSRTSRGPSPTGIRVPRPACGLVGRTLSAGRLRGRGLHGARAARLVQPGLTGMRGRARLAPAASQPAVAREQAGKAAAAVSAEYPPAGTACLGGGEGR